MDKVGNDSTYKWLYKHVHEYESLFPSRVSTPYLEANAGHGGQSKKRIVYLRYMSVRTLIEQIEGTYFITFTCQNWLPLFEITKSYNAVYKWFDYLATNNHNIRGYVFMLNHYY